MEKRKDRPEFYMMAGLPGSGKSFIAGKMLEEAGASGRDMVRVSSDAIRKELFGAEEIQKDPNRVFELMRKRTIEALDAGVDVIYDACNISTKRRRAFLKSLGRRECGKICLIAAATYGKCLERNRLRDRKVPEEAVERMYKNWCTPALFEGWDRIQICYAPGEEGKLGDPEAFIEKHMDYDQINPHHRETLGMHLRDIGAYLKEKGIGEESNLALAAMLHDCGKPFTRTFGVAKDGSEIAHYYQHANVGSYDAMFYDYLPYRKSMEDILEISLLIGLHMNPFFWKNGGAREKNLDTWGQELFDQVTLLNEADDASRERDL